MRLGIDPAAGSAGTDRVSYSSIRQPFIISPFASTAQLRWWQFNRTEEAPAPAPPASADRQEVILLQPELKTEVVLSRVRSNETGWTQQLVDLTSYRGPVPGALLQYLQRRQRSAHLAVPGRCADRRLLPGSDGHPDDADLYPNRANADPHGDANFGACSSSSSPTWRRCPWRPAAWEQGR